MFTSSGRFPYHRSGWNNVPPASTTVPVSPSTPILLLWHVWLPRYLISSSLSLNSHASVVSSILCFWLRLTISHRSYHLGQTPRDSDLNHVIHCALCANFSTRLVACTSTVFPQDRGDGLGVQLYVLRETEDSLTASRASWQVSRLG